MKKLSKKANRYLHVKLRNKLKEDIMKGSEGGKAGQWSARKSQMLALAYKNAGGKYIGGKSKEAKSLDKWTKQKWRTKSGKPSLETGERYFPEKLVKSMTPSQYAYETKRKRESMKEGKQFAKYSKKTIKLVNKLKN